MEAMSEKIRGVIFITVGVIAMYQGYLISHRRPGIPQMYLEFGLGALAIGLGIWRFMKKPKDAAAPEAGLEQK